MAYWAFISYSSKDKEVAEWLRKRLEHYPIPREFRGKDLGDDLVIGKHLSPVFRDRDELPSGASLSSGITAALEQSHYLIVLCSRNSARSKWVNREIEWFQNSGRGDRVLTLIVDGRPNATRDEGIPDSEECLPPLLRAPQEPLAADLRAGRDGKKAAFLKIVAGMIELGLDDLVKRDSQRKRRVLAIWSVTTCILIAMISSLAIYGLSESEKATKAGAAKLSEQKRADEQTVEARHQLGRSWLERAKAQSSPLDRAFLAGIAIGFEQDAATGEAVGFPPLLRSESPEHREAELLHRLSQPVIPLWWNELASDFQTPLFFSADSSAAIGFAHDPRNHSAESTLAFWSLPEGNSIPLPRPLDIFEDFSSMVGANDLQFHLSPRRRFVEMRKYAVVGDIFSLSDGKPAAQFNLNDHLVSSSVFSPDGRYHLLVSSPSGVSQSQQGSEFSATVTDLEGGKQLAKFPFRRTVGAAISSSGRWIALVEQDRSSGAFGGSSQTHTISFLNPTELQDPVITKIPREYGMPSALLFLPGDSSYLAAFDSGLVELRSLDDHSIGLTLCDPGSPSVKTFHLPPDADFVLGVCADGSIVKWPLQEGKPLQDQSVLNLTGVTWPNLESQLSPDGKQLLVWKEKTRFLLETTPLGIRNSTGTDIFRGSISNVITFSQDGRYLASASEKELKLWAVDEGGNGALVSRDFGGTGSQRFGLRHEDGELVFWNVHKAIAWTANPTASIDSKSVPFRPGNLGMRDDGRFILITGNQRSWGGQGYAITSDLDEVIHKIPELEKDETLNWRNQSGVSTDGRWIWYQVTKGKKAGIIRFLDAYSGELVGQCEHAIEDLESVDLSAMPHHALLRFRKEPMVLWSASAAVEQLQVIEPKSSEGPLAEFYNKMPSPVSCISRDGSRIAYLTNAPLFNTIAVARAGDGRIEHVLKGHRPEITSLRFSPVDPSILASADATGALVLWEFGDRESNTGGISLPYSPSDIWLTDQSPPILIAAPIWSGGLLSDNKPLSIAYPNGKGESIEGITTFARSISGKKLIAMLGGVTVNGGRPPQLALISPGAIDDPKPLNIKLAPTDLPQLSTLIADRILIVPGIQGQRWFNLEDNTSGTATGAKAGLQWDASKQGKVIASFSPTTAHAKVWKDGDLRKSVVQYEGPGGLTSAIAVSENVIAIGDKDGKVCVRDLESKEVLFEASAHRGVVGDLFLSEHGTRLVTCGQDGFFAIYDLETKEEEIRVHAHEGGISIAKVGESFASLLTFSSDDNLVKTWKLTNRPRSKAANDLFFDAALSGLWSWDPEKEAVAVPLNRNNLFRGRKGRTLRNRE